MPPRIKVLTRDGAPNKCAYCDARPTVVVHYGYENYKPTEEEREQKRRPFEKTYMEKFACLTHFNLNWTNNEARYFELVGQADFTCTPIEVYMNRSKLGKGRIFFYEV